MSPSRERRPSRLDPMQTKKIDKNVGELADHITKPGSTKTQVSRRLMMKIHSKLVRKAILGCVVLGLAASGSQITLAQRFDRRGGGQPQIGGGGGVGGGARPSLGGAGRPSGGLPNAGAMTRPNTGNLRPTQPVTRPGNGSMPSLGGTARPQIPNLQSPGISRPSTGVQRPPTSIPRPVNPDLGSRPSLQVPGSLRPTTRPSFPDSGFDRPTRPTLPERPQTLPGIPPTSIPRPITPERPSIGNRPSFPSRPTYPDRPTFPSRPDRPSIGDNRPSFPSRPDYPSRPDFPNRPGYPDRPGYPNRPGGNDWNRPGYPDRPIVDNRPSRPNRPNIGGGNLVIGGGNTNININNNNINNWYGNSNWGWGNQVGWNQGWGWNTGWNSGWNSGWNQPSWYNGHWNSHWGTSWYRPATSLYVGWGLSSWSSYSTFVNPYYVPSTMTTFSYSQPIVINSMVRDVPQQSVERVPAEPDADTVALELFDEGVAAFHDGNFIVAMNKFDTAVHRLSGDPVLHEMRALTYFALGKYQESAAVLNALLATSPGMDWTTMSGLYGDVEIYTQQLRKLESHIESNPNDAAALFVLAYHYLVTGHQQDAAELLADVVRLQPKDVTASEMLRALTAEDDQQEPQSTAPPAKVASAQAEAKTDLVGKWVAKPEGVTITLEVTESSTFTWRAEPKPIDGKPAAEPTELKGDVLASGNTLVLNTESQGAMSGKVQSQGANQFRFIVPGGPPNDPGLTFDRQN